MASVREFRILISYKNSLRKLCKLFFSARDASLYLIPYALGGEYYYGVANLPEEQGQITLTYTGQFFSKKVPKLSIHQSGQIHVYGDQGRAGPVLVPSLNSFSGQHIATVSTDGFDAIPLFKDNLKNSGPKVDHIVPVGKGVDSGRVVFYLNANKPAFPVRCRVVATLKRPNLLKPYYVGIATLGQLPLNPDSDKRGVAILAGWDPTKPDDAEQSFLYIRSL